MAKVAVVECDSEIGEKEWIIRDEVERVVIREEKREIEKHGNLKRVARKKIAILRVEKVSILLRVSKKFGFSA
jgi:hypothetical protein